MSLFVIPIFDQWLVYAPLRSLAALVNRAAVLRLRDGLLAGRTVSDGRLEEIVDALQDPSPSPPQPRRGDLAPACLGLLPTRGCNFACRYCGFLIPDRTHGVMDLQVARDTVEWYIDLVSKSGLRDAEIHYFGGEPFCAEEVLDLTVPLARIRAQEAGCAVRFEVATNGAFGEERCRWAADNLDTIVTLRNVLQGMGRADLVRALLEDRAALERAVLQGSDALADVGEGL